MSEIDSNDEWIIEFEDPVLDNDTSLKDIGEFFLNLFQIGTSVISSHDKRQGMLNANAGKLLHGKILFLNKNLSLH